MSRTRKPAVRPDEASLFRLAVSDVTRLPQHGKAELARPRPKPVPAQRLRDDRQALHESLSDQLPWDADLEAGDALSYVRNGIGAQTLRKLRRGHWILQDELDLHGHTVEEARGQLGEFLARCIRRGLRCVRVIHGKGLRSRNREPVLKKQVASWLMRREDVLAFCQARAADGGSGAVVVLLKGVVRGS